MRTGTGTGTEQTSFTEPTWDLRLHIGNRRYTGKREVDGEVGLMGG